MPESAKKAKGKKGYQEQTESLRRGEGKKSGRLVGATEKCDFFVFTILVISL